MTHEPSEQDRQSDISRLSMLCDSLVTRPDKLKTTQTAKITHPEVREAFQLVVSEFSKIDWESLNKVEYLWHIKTNILPKVQHSRLAKNSLNWAINNREWFLNHA